MTLALSTQSLTSRYEAVRSYSQKLLEPLSPEDAGAQSMPDTSPAKWHVAHTTWFFETVVLEALDPGYVSPFAGYRALFNSYYQAVGPQFARPQRGLITRPTLAEILHYRAFIDQRVLSALAGDLPAAVVLWRRVLARDADDATAKTALPRVMLALGERRR